MSLSLSFCYQFTGCLNLLKQYLIQHYNLVFNAEVQIACVMWLRISNVAMEMPVSYCSFDSSNKDILG